MYETDSQPELIVYNVFKVITYGKIKIKKSNLETNVTNPPMLVLSRVRLKRNQLSLSLKKVITTQKICSISKYF